MLQSNNNDSNFFLTGLDDWSEADVLTKVLAASQEEYLLTLKNKQSKDSSYGEKCNSDNQFQSHEQTNILIKSVEEETSSASNSPKSHMDKNTEKDVNQGENSDIDSQIPEQNLAGCNVSPKSIITSVSNQKSSEIVQIQKDTSEKDSESLMENSQTNNDRTTEHPLIRFVPREHSETSGVINQQLSEAVSKTNSPDPEDQRSKRKINQKDCYK